MITITIENQDMNKDTNNINLKVEGNGKESDLIQEAIFLITHHTDIYSDVVDRLSPLAQMHVLLKALNFQIKKG